MFLFLSGRARTHGWVILKGGINHEWLKLPSSNSSPIGVHHSLFVIFMVTCRELSVEDVTSRPVSFEVFRRFRGRGPWGSCVHSHANDHLKVQLNEPFFEISKFMNSKEFIIFIISLNFLPKDDFTWGFQEKRSQTPTIRVILV